MNLCIFLKLFTQDLETPFTHIATDKVKCKQKRVYLTFKILTKCKLDIAVFSKYFLFVLKREWASLFRVDF